MNQSLTKYPPYARFLQCLKHEKKIPIPPRQDKLSRKALGKKLREKHDITFVAVDIFRSWAVSVGQAYFSPIDHALHWGGEWDSKQPTSECFEKICKESYGLTDKTSGYSNIGRVADLVCKRLSISFQAFEKKMNEHFDAFSDDIRLAPATARRESPVHLRIPTVRSRSAVSGERLTRESQGHRLREISWIESRYLEDGIHLKDKLVTLIRWEV